MLFTLYIFLEPVIKLLLVVEKEELVFEDLGAAQLGLLLVIVSVSDASEELSVLVHLHLSLGLLVLEVLTHFFKMVLKELIVTHLSSEIDFLSKANQVALLVRTSKAFRAGSVAVTRAHEALTCGLRIWIRDMEVTIVGRGGPAMTSHRGCDHRNSRVGFLTGDFRAKLTAASLDRLRDFVASEKLPIVLPLNQLVVDAEVADLEVQSKVPASAGQLTN